MVARLPEQRRGAAVVVGRHRQLPLPRYRDVGEVEDARQPPPEGRVEGDEALRPAGPLRGCGSWVSLGTFLTSR